MEMIMEFELILEAKPVLRRYRITYLGKEILLTARSFKMIAKLVTSRFAQPDTFIPSMELEPDGQGTKTLSRLRVELGTSPWEIQRSKHGMGGYRLTIPPDKLFVNWMNLESVDDYELRQWAHRMYALGRMKSGALSH